jgi:hypothetical protein
MAFPAPFPGLVFRYAFLWSLEAAQGRQEGKDRPCVVLLAVRRAADGTIRVRVAPVTHSPKTPAAGLEIPAKVRRHLGLDEAASWISLTEANEFVWPGPDVRPIPGRPGVWSYGVLPVEVFTTLTRRIAALRRKRSVRRTP